MVKCGLLLSLLLGSVLSFPMDSSSLDAAWKTWKTTHKKEYNSLGEEAIRRAVWEENMRLIEKHNQEYELGMHTYELGMNQFGDMTSEELAGKSCLIPPNGDPKNA